MKTKLEVENGSTETTSGQKSGYKDDYQNGSDKYQFFTTEEALSFVSPVEKRLALMVHLGGEWGVVSKEEADSNNDVFAGRKPGVLITRTLSLFGEYFVVVSDPATGVFVTAAEWEVPSPCTPEFIASVLAEHSKATAPSSS